MNDQNKQSTVPYCESTAPTWRTGALSRVSCCLSSSCRPPPRPPSAVLPLFYPVSCHALLSPSLVLCPVNMLLRTPASSCLSVPQPPCVKLASGLELFHHASLLTVRLVSQGSSANSQSDGGIVLSVEITRSVRRQTNICRFIGNRVNRRVQLVSDSRLGQYAQVDCVV